VKFGKAKYFISVFMFYNSKTLITFAARFGIIFPVNRMMAETQNRYLIESKMNNRKEILRFGVICAIILVAAASRFIPHLPNFTPLGGIALFGAAYYGRRFWAYLVPLAAIFLSDVLLNNVIFRFGIAPLAQTPMFSSFTWLYSGALYTYAAMALIVLLGTFTLKKVRVTNVLFSALGASAIFFIVSNFGTWASGLVGYPHTFAGLISCYIAGLPFALNTIAGDLAYAALLFGAFELIQTRFPSVKLQHAI